MTAFFLCVLAAQANFAATPPVAVPLVLVTIDTTRADALGIYGGKASTPNLDALARRGVRWHRALAPAPLTLPSHATIMTGRTPPRHGVRDNSTDTLAEAFPTLAEELSAHGFHTMAVVASRVLDRRFGLDQGFDVYDDHMTAELRGEYGYAERRADAVVNAALSHLGKRPKDRPFFLWVHLYDPHAPYDAPERQSATERYHAEIEFCDRQLGRLFGALPSDTVVAVVGDHGEALGEHGEDTHGLFLYESSLRVPMIVAGPGVPRDREMAETVAIRRLGHSLLRILGLDGSELPGPALPGLGSEPEGSQVAEVVYSETLLPASAYGWSPLHSVSEGRTRYILAPRPELYDVGSDPAESRNLAESRPEVSKRLRSLVEAELAEAVDRQDAALDQETRSQLEALGYLSGSSSPDAADGTDLIDPKDGLARLEQFDRAKDLRQVGNLEGAIALFTELLETNPDNGPVRSRLAEALLAAGRPEQALALYREAVERRPDFEFARFQLATALLNQGKYDQGQAELERVLDIDSRFADAWLTLAELAHRRGDPGEEKRLLEAAVDAGTESAGLFVRLGMRLAAGTGPGDPERAADLLRRATEAMPGWAVPWLVRGQILLQQGKTVEAKSCLLEASRLAPPSSAEGAEARRLLAGL